MGDLFWNKVFGALLAVVLVIMGLQTLSGTLFPMGGHGGGHGDEEAHSLNEWAQGRFAYYTEIAESGAGGAVEEEVYDLGALLASADASSGERSFKAKCSTCHTIEAGGASGTGPNLHGILTSTHAHSSGFGYSSAMQATAGEPWTYEAIDHWLENPSSYIRGTTMAFAGLRRDDERADVIAYLASMTPNAPAFPEPLPEEAEEGEAVEAEGEAAEGEAEATEAAAETGETEAETGGDATEGAAPAEAEEEAVTEEAPAEQPADAPTEEAEEE